MQRQQLHIIATQRLQRLQLSMEQQDVAGQEQALQELVIWMERTGVEAKQLVLQQPDFLAMLARLFRSSRSSTSRASSLAAMLLAGLALAGSWAAEHITTQPGLVGALAQLLARNSSNNFGSNISISHVSISSSYSISFGSNTSSSRAAATWRFAALQATTCFSRICYNEVAARRVAAEPAAVSGLLSLLSVADTIIDHSGRQHSLAGQAQLALKCLAACGGGAALHTMLQQPGVVAALTDALQPQHTSEAQSTALAVLNDAVSGLLKVDGAHATAQQVVQQIARQPGVLDNVVRLPNSGLPGSRAGAMLHYMVFFDGTVGKQLLERPAAMAALASVLDSKESNERQAPVQTFLQNVNRWVHLRGQADVRACPCARVATGMLHKPLHLWLCDWQPAEGQPVCILPCRNSL